MRRSLPAFIRPYLLLVLGTAILLSFVVVGSDLNEEESREVDASHSRDAHLDGPPAGVGAPPHSILVPPAQQPEEPAAARELPTATPAPSATLRPTSMATSMAEPTDTPPPTDTPRPTDTPFPTDTPQPTPEIADLGATTNVLILGSDQRLGQPNWRTDVIILLMMNPTLGEAAIISFPRDMYVDPIPGHASNRINVIDYLGEMDAPGGGGPRLLISILEDRLGITIDDYVRFRFEGFVDLIDAMGGLRIYVDCHLYESYPEEGIYLNLAPGEHTLTGQQALSYVRSRKSSGDLDRARRQQRVVWALRKQLVEDGMGFAGLRMLRLYETLRYSVDTDVGWFNALMYARFGLSLNEASVKGMVLSKPHALRPGWRQGMSVFLVDWRYIASELRRVFDRPPLAETNTAVSPIQPQQHGGGGDNQGDNQAAVAQPVCP